MSQKSEKNHSDAATSKETFHSKESDSTQPEIELTSRKELEEKLNEAEAQINLLRDQLLRTQAELQNIQKRSEKKMADIEKFAIQGFAKELLAVIDNFERALLESASQPGTLLEGIPGALLEGVQRTYELFLTVFNKFGIKPVDPKGEIFNHDLHEAISTVPAEVNQQDNCVVQVLQKGYLLNDRLIRPALVIVAKKS